MKKIIVLMAVAAAASLSFAQYRAADRLAGMMIEGRPFLTDAARYNSYDLAGSPLGVFEIGTPRFGAEASYRYYGFGDESGHYLSGQTVRMGQPGRVLTELFYGPDILTDKNSQNSQNKASAVLQRFGLMAATQTTDGFFRSSILFDGYFGGQEWGNNNETRALMGIERLRLDVGSQVHPLVRLGFFGTATVHLDTLRVPSDAGRSDRSAQMNLPEFGGNIDFGGEGGDLPVRSNLSVSYALSRFVYTAKPVGMFGPPTVDGRGNADAILTDSLRVTWLIYGEAPIRENYVARLGMLVGVTNNYGKRHWPHDENDPLQPGGVKDGLDYTLSGTHIGVGSGAQLHKYADAHAEYSLSAMSLDCGDMYPGPAVKTRTLHSISFGASAPLHKYLELPLQITPRIAYFISGASGIVSPVHSGLDPLNVIPGKSKGALYQPDMYLAGFERTRGFTLGLDAGALEEKLAASLWLTFLSKDEEKKGGMEMGMSVGYSM